MAVEEDQLLPPPTLRCGMISAVVVSLMFAFVLAASSFVRVCRHGGMRRGSRTDGRHGLQRRLPPSPPGLPLVGNLHQLGALPHRSLRELSRRYGPLMFLRLGSRAPILVVSSAGAARDVLKTHDPVFASRPASPAIRRLTYGCKDVLFAPYGEYWRQVRKVCVLHLLSSKQVQAFRRVREEEVSALVDDMISASGGGGGSPCARPVNLSHKLAGLTQGVMNRTTLGKRYLGEDADAREFRAMVGEFFVLIGAFTVGEFIPWLGWVDWLTGFHARLRKCFRRMDRFLETIVEERSQALDGSGSTTCVVQISEKCSFMDILLTLQASSGNSIGTESVKAILMDMLIAGTDTTTSTVEWAMVELVRHPAAMKRVQDEVRAVAKGKALLGEDDLEQLGYLKQVVKEVLRLHPPGPLLAPHESLEDVELHGYHIPAKTRVLVNVWAIARDPGLWERAEDFWPERFDGGSPDFNGQHFQFLPFGFGRRGCPGLTFAVPLVELALANLLRGFDWRSPQGEDLDMAEASGLAIHRKASLVLVPLPPVRDDVGLRDDGDVAATASPGVL